MATFTVTVPDPIVAEALAAAGRINARLPEADRQKALAFTDVEATDIIFQWLQNLILNDLQQGGQIAAELQIRAKAAELAATRTATAPATA